MRLRRPRAIALVVLAVACSGQAAQMQNEQIPAQDDPPGWTRHAVPAAGVSIAHNPAWPTLEERNLVYQRFGRADGAISLHWGEDATIDWYLAHVGLGSGAETRVLVEDVAVDLGGLHGRRVRLRMVPYQPAPSLDQVGRSATTGTSHGGTRLVFVAVGFQVHGQPVRVSYRVPEHELAEFETLLEQVVAGVRPL